MEEEKDAASPQGDTPAAHPVESADAGAGSAGAESDSDVSNIDDEEPDSDGSEVLNEWLECEASPRWHWVWGVPARAGSGHTSFLLGHCDGHRDVRRTGTRPRGGCPLLHTRRTSAGSGAGGALPAVQHGALAAHFPKPQGAEGQGELDEAIAAAAADTSAGPAQLRVSECADLARAGALSSLQVLTLVDCGGLEHLPPALGALPALRRLWLWRCPDLSSLGPPGGGGGALPTSLEVLWVYDCGALPSLGAALAPLARLSVLRLHDCGALTSLGGGGGDGDGEGKASGGALPAGLQELSLQRLPLRRLPAAAAALPRLAKLKVMRCPEVTHLPPGLGALPALTRLVVSGCAKLAALDPGPASGALGGAAGAAPPAAPPFAALEVLCVASCPALASLGPAFDEAGALPRLKDLYLENCASLTLGPPGAGLDVDAVLEPPVFSRLRRRLLLRGCPRVEGQLPAAAAALARLRKLLELDGCGTLTQLPAGLSALTSLQQLSVSRCGALASLGPSLPPNLTALSVSGCPVLEGLPECMGSLSRLRRLALSDCAALAALPAAVARCTALESLRASHCPRLAAPPAALAALPRLAALAVDGGEGDEGVCASTREQVEAYFRERPA